MRKILLSIFLGCALTVFSSSSEAQIVISEVMASPSNNADDFDEYIELYNTTGSALDLNGWQFTDGDALDTIVMWDTGIHGSLADTDVVTNTTILPVGGYAIILDPEYNDTGAGATEPYDFPIGTVILTVADTTLGNGLTGTDPITLYNGGGTALGNVVDTYGTPVEAEDPLDRDDDGLDGIPLNVSDGNSASRIDPFGIDEESNWQESQPTPGYWDTGDIADIIYVKQGASGDGTSWASAYGFLQDALAVAGPNDQIWVAEGIYYPDANSIDPNGTGNREETFQLVNGVGLYGGFPSQGDPNLNDRDPNLYETILSGDINTPDDSNDNSYHVVTGSGTDANAVFDGFTITAGNADETDPDPNNGLGGGMFNLSGSSTVSNCRFISNSGFGSGMCNRESSSPTVSNCTFISNSDIGMFNWSSSPILIDCTFSGNSSSSGGGMFNYLSDPTVSGCTFADNSATSEGGGMHNFSSSPMMTNCIFNYNSSYRGGGIYNREGSSPTVTNCIFIGNFAETVGGGMFNYSDSNSIVTGCIFVGNSANVGGGMDNAHSDPTVTNCIFTGNLASGLGAPGPGAGGGGGMYNWFSSSSVTNCTFTGNTALGSSLYNEGGGGMNNWGGNIIMSNCIFWGNTAPPGGDEIALGNNSIIDVNYCSIQGGPSAIYEHDSGNSINWGSGNIDVDPCFVDAGRWVDVNDPNIIVEPNDPNAMWVDGDYHLKSEGWRWDSVRQRWDWDDVTSRCIDAGNPGSPLSDELMSVPDDPCNIWGENIRINMGAFGGTAEASMPPYDWSLLSDITNNGIVDLFDYAYLAYLYTVQNDELPADFDRDGDVDFADLGLLVQDWLQETSWH